MAQPRLRFLSDHTLMKQSDSHLLWDTPPSPVIQNLELEGEELDDLCIPPSDEFEKNKETITSFFSNTTRTDDCSFKSGKELRFSSFDVTLKSNRLRRGRSKSCCHKSPKIFDLLLKGKTN